MTTPKRLNREIPVTAIPDGKPSVLAAGTEIYIVQTLGGNVTIRAGGSLFRVAQENADAIDGYTAKAVATAAGAVAGELSEQVIREALRTCFDPEIPVNIVDLGVVYDLNIEKNASGGHDVEVKMTLTAPGCGMGPVIAEDARQKIAALPSVSSAKVHIVWDPAWTPQMISAQGRQILGLE